MFRARRRMLAAVPKATVVITNPTHYAVALAYDRAKHAAPRVVAKGVDTLAARIREVAEANRVPVVTNPPLARALYRVELDADIPAEHYQAVAEIIAYVWRLGRGRAAPDPQGDRAGNGQSRAAAQDAVLASRNTAIGRSSSVLADAAGGSNVACWPLRRN